MTAKFVDALEAHGAFERDDGRFVVTTTPFDAWVWIEPGTENPCLLIEVWVPDIDDAVEDESVADIVRDGWFETFERRISAVSGITYTEPETTVEQITDTEVRVSFTLELSNQRYIGRDAKALVDYVEGTYLQGTIPGYDYRDPVDSMLRRAGDRSEGGGRPKL